MIIFLGLIMGLVVTCLIASILLRHPVHALLMLILSFLLIAILLLLSGIEYLATLILLIYGGAISILLLFVLMMFDMKELYLLDYFERLKSKSRLFSKLVIALLLFFIFLIGFSLLAYYYYPIVVMRLYENDWNLHLDWASIFQHTSDIKSIGYVLYRFFFIIPIFIALMVLTTLVGCLALVSQLHKGAKTQINAVQVTVKTELNIK